MLEIVRPLALFERLAHHPKIGIGEAYMAGDWRAAPGTDLADLLLPFAERLTTPRARRRCAAAARRRPADPRAPSATRWPGRASNIQAHYDLSNDLFAAFLDQTLSYSSATLRRPRRRGPSRPSRRPSCARSTRSSTRPGSAPGTRVLEIGTGWGTLAIEAARRGAHVTT